MNVFINLLFGLILVPCIAYLIWEHTRKPHRMVYVKPFIQSMTITTGKILEFDSDQMVIGSIIVESSHSEHITREMTLPTGSYITTLVRNSLYCVRFPLPANVLTDTPQYLTDLWYMEAVAANNNYVGPITNEVVYTAKKVERGGETVYIYD